LEKLPNSEASLAQQCPKIARDWHPIKNAWKTPSDVSPTNDALVYWRCPSGHVERMSPRQRVIRNGRCVRCSMLRLRDLPR
jgi:hypothetical protein